MAVYATICRGIPYAFLLIIIISEVKIYATEYCNRINSVYKRKPFGFHAVAAMKKEFRANGFTALAENERWHLQAGGNYFVTRNDSSIIAFSIPQTVLTAYVSCKPQ